MPKTVVGLFEKSVDLEEVVRDVEALGFPRNEVRTLEEPRSFEINGLMSFPRLDFETALVRSLKKIGASEGEANAYLDGLRRGGGLVFATGPDEKVDAAAAVMYRHGAAQTARTAATEPQLPHIFPSTSTGPTGDSPIVAGRVEQPAGTAFFVW